MEIFQTGPRETMTESTCSCLVVSGDRLDCSLLLFACAPSCLASRTSYLPALPASHVTSYYVHLACRAVQCLPTSRYVLSTGLAYLGATLPTSHIRPNPPPVSMYLLALTLTLTLTFRLTYILHTPQTNDHFPRGPPFLTFALFSLSWKLSCHLLLWHGHSVYHLPLRLLLGGVSTSGFVCFHEPYYIIILWHTITNLLALPGGVETIRTWLLTVLSCLC
ncbi:hypothetical protein F5Y07DRAFT_248548 [Xylaria sp. FL0933]|nr:hypothetical protein F5Y07DRAFT_248548 [Xylaria sp. FL0933]